MYSPTRTDDFVRVNTVDTFFLAFVHAQSVSSHTSDSSPSAFLSSTTSSSWRGPGRTVWPAMGDRAKAATGCYAVRAVSVWGGVGPLSDVVCLSTESSWKSSSSSSSAAAVNTSAVAVAQRY